MGYSHDLILVLLLFYMLECLIWTNSSIFVEGPNGFRRRFPSTLLGNHSAGLVMASFCPWNRFYLSWDPPFRVMRSHVSSQLTFVWTDRSISVGLSEITEISRDSKTVRLNQLPLLRFPTADHAQHFEEWLSQLMSPQIQGDQFLAQQVINRWFDAEDAMCKHSSFENMTNDLKAACTRFWVAVILCCLLSLLYARLFVNAWTTIIMLLILVVLWWQCVSLSSKYRRRFLRSPPRTYWQELMTMILLPVNAMRQYAERSKTMMVGIHPLTLSALFSDKGDFQFQAEKELRQLCQPFFQASDQWAYDRKTSQLPVLTRNQAVKILKEIQLQPWSEAVLRLIAQAGLSPLALLTPPEENQGAFSYCPVCLHQYTQSRELCSHCETQTLFRFSESDHPSNQD